MTRNFLFLLFYFSFLSDGMLVALETKPVSIDSVMNEIRQEQRLTNGQDIDVNKVSPKLLEELGDSVMEVMIANSALHEQMDKRMGGEGSASLAAIHQRIGYNYLSGYPLGMTGMMGLGWGFGWGGMFMGLLFLIIIVLIIFFAVRAARGGNFTGQSSLESPMEILKKRYAKGEITKDEFEKIRKDL